jgi:hypothetical protein
MSLLTEKQNGALSVSKVAGYQSETLEAILQNLCHLGVPSLLRMNNGWWVTLKMHVAAAGTEFTVKSESDNPTPTAAAKQCAERAIATLKQWAS